MPEDSADHVLPLSISGVTVTAPLVTTRIEEEVMAFFDELRVPLFRYGLAFRLSSHDCEDVIQEVFLALFQHLLQGRSRQNLRGWIFRVMHNLALKRCDGNRRIQQQQQESSGIHEPADGSPNAEDQMVWNERRSRLLSVFDALPDADRCCLQLRAEGLNYREIAEILGISLGSVSQYLTRSLARLARADGR
ncbi:MAG TPA: sigma-70 family RNA polymerase sigma factor [Terriglobales bacterium]|nr:sigma-70 family RNA polymerase sigma factor [Terriglobales bacterium]